MAPRHANLLESFSVRFSVEFEGTAERALTLHTWMPVLPPGTRVALRGSASRRYRLRRQGNRFLLYIDDVLQASVHSLRQAQDLLEGDLALHVAANAPTHVFIHAGVVGVRGRALVLPGRSMSGKSTLVAQLVAAGATYYSDEYAVLDSTGRVHPYPRRLSLRRSQGLPRRLTPSRVGRGPLRVACVVGSQFVRALAEPQLHALSPGLTAMLLIDNAVAARIVPERVLPAVRAIAGSAAGWSMQRGEAANAVESLLSRCAQKQVMIGSLRKKRG